MSEVWSNLQDALSPYNRTPSDVEPDRALTKAAQEFESERFFAGPFGHYIPDDGEPALKDSGQREQFPSGMVRDIRTGKGRYDLISPYALRRLALVYEAGAQKYDDYNWLKGAPYCRFVDSALRHIQQWQMGHTDEDHLANAAWNLFCILHFDSLGRSDLDDRRWSVE